MNSDTGRSVEIAMTILALGLAAHTAWQLRAGVFETRFGIKIEKKKSPVKFRIEAILRFSIALVILVSMALVSIYR